MHTPGPWRADGPRIYTDHADRAADKVGQILVAKVSGLCSEEQEDADAGLIAAAPELLATTLVLRAELFGANARVTALRALLDSVPEPCDYVGDSELKAAKGSWRAFLRQFGKWNLKVHTTLAGEA